MKNLLFLVHRIPYPPNKGDKIRSFNLLRHLSGHYNVFLGGFIDDEGDWQHVAPVSDYCKDLKLCAAGGWSSKLSAGIAILMGRSLSVAYYADRELNRWVNELASKTQIDCVVCFSSTMAQFIPEGLSGSTVVVADFVDLDSDKWHQYSSEKRWPMSWIYSYEASALAKWELATLERVDAVTLVSDEEKRLAERRFGALGGRFSVVRNGVDIDFFDPSITLENPYSPNGPIVVFTGAMDYYANVHGVRWFVENIWENIREKVPAAEFWIVGSNPSHEVLELESVEGVMVTGFVNDVRPYLKYAELSVAPLELARGVQNKVLEALAMNLPVVATPQALQGLDGALPESVRSVSESILFCDAVLANLSEGRNRLDPGGRDYIRRFYDWDRNLSVFDKLLSVSDPRGVM